MRPHLISGLGHDLDDAEWAQFTQMAPLIQERTKFFSDAADQVRFLFSDSVEYDEPSWSKVMEKEGVADVLRVSADKLEALDTFDHDAIEAALRAMLEELEIGARKGLQPLRVAITGSQVSPPLFESISALGKARTLARLTDCQSRLS